MQTTRRSAGVLAAFAAPCIPLAALGLPLVVYLPEYYANELGLGLATVGAIFMWVRLADVVFDPLVGAAMDRTRTRFGRFKPWLAAGLPLLFISGWMLFFAEPGVSALRLWIWLPVAYAAFSICVLSQTSWGSLLSEDYNQRSRIYGWWQTANVIGVILALLLAAIPLLLGDAETGRTASVRAMGWFILISSPICIVLALWKAPEPPAPVARHSANLKDWIGLFTNAAVRRIVAVDLFIGIGLGIVAALFFFYFERVKGLSQAGTGILLLLYFISGLAFAPMWAWLARRLQKHRATALATVCTALGQLLLLLPPEGNLVVAGMVVVLAGVPFSAAALLLRAMMADAGDEIRLDTGIDRTGLLYALVACTNKLGSALAVGITYPLLSAAGFSASGDGDPNQGLAALSAIYVAAPVTLCLLAAFLMTGYRLGPQRHAEILAALEARKTDG
jgi:glycoside/pentoside/hexuronide:cation symporter, GPH family